MELTSDGILINLDFVNRTEEPGLGVPFSDKDIVAIFRLVRVNELKTGMIIQELNIDFLVIKKITIFHNRRISDNISKII